MKIRVKDLMEISTNLLYDTMVLSDTSFDTEKRFNVESASDIEELFECDRPVLQFWVAEGEMCIIVE